MSMCYWCQQKSYCQEMNQELHDSIDQGEIYCESFTQKGLPDISMGRTTPSWVTENKEVTRRQWSTPTMRRFKKDATYLAWSRQPRFGGQPLGIGRMTEDAFREETGVHLEGGQDSILRFHMAEGFKYLDDRLMEIRGNPIVGMDSYKAPDLLAATLRWLNANLLVSVVPFKIVEVFPEMMKKYSTDEEIVRSVKALVEALP